MASVDLSLKNGPRQSIYWVSDRSSAPSNSFRLISTPGTRKARHWKTSAVYKGEWKNDKKHGFGVQTWANGNKYEGEWQEGRREGRGILWVSGPSGDLWKIYSGGWASDEKNGPGVYFYKNGERYEGEWKNNERSGLGSFFFLDGSSYSGAWAFGLQNGFGTLKKNNGDIYEGNWLNGKREGAGIYFYRAQQRIYDGEWSNDQPTCGVLTEAQTFFREEKGEEKTTLPIPRLRMAEPTSVLADSIAEVEKSRSSLRSLFSSGLALEDFLLDSLGDSEISRLAAIFQQRADANGRLSLADFIPIFRHEFNFPSSSVDSVALERSIIRPLLEKAAEIPGEEKIQNSMKIKEFLSVLAFAREKIQQQENQQALPETIGSSAPQAEEEENQEEENS